MNPDLLESVFRSPDDDAPRRALADSLRRDGDPRGGFIALQLDTQLTCWSETKLGALRRVDVAPEVRARMTALSRKHRRAWSDDARAGLNALDVARGFVEPRSEAAHRSGDERRARDGAPPRPAVAGGPEARGRAAAGDVLVATDRAREAAHHAHARAPCAIEGPE